ncbi:transmembrane protein, putative [Medicago truncatula]|uniref:Transmembrane protein, putative n=1 Tax=Medicago truncatula TaxID=3880 RepID=G7J8Z3_MEDTR|nr:transmembrane protein, putative [Medicago truncatula]
MNHTCTQQHSPSSVSPSIHHALLLACIAVAGFVQPLLFYPMWATVGSLRGARGTVHIEARTTAQARETSHSYPKP